MSQCADAPPFSPLLPLRFLCCPWMMDHPRLLSSALFSTPVLSLSPVAFHAMDQHIRITSPRSHPWLTKHLERDTHFLSCLMRKSVSQPLLCFVPCHLHSSLCSLHTSCCLFFFFFSFLEHMLPPAIMTLYWMVPIMERFFFQHSHGCIFSNIPISSLSWVSYLKCSQQTHFTWLYSDFYIAVITTWSFFLFYLDGLTVFSSLECQPHQSV